MQQSCPMRVRHPKAGLHQLAAHLLFWSRAPVCLLQLPACQSNSRRCAASSLTRVPMAAWCAMNTCHPPQQAVPPQTWMRSHTGAGDSAGVSTPAVADPLPCATAAVPCCCLGRGATYTSQPPTSRTRSAGTAAEALSVSIALLRTQKGNGCPTATTPTCKFTWKHLDHLLVNVTTSGGRLACTSTAATALLLASAQTGT